MTPRPQTLLITAILLLAQSCSSYVDLDVTLFDHVDLSEQLEFELEAIPEKDEVVTITHRTDLNLADQLGDDLLQQIDDITINELYYSVPENTMTAELDVVEIFIGPPEALTPADSGVVKIAQLSRIQPGVPVEKTVLVPEPEGYEGLTQHLLQFNMTMFITARVRVGPGKELPSGVGLFEIDVKASVHNY